MKFGFVLLVFVFLLVGFLVVFLYEGDFLTGSVVKDNSFSYTRAICNADKECIDAIIHCEGGRVKEIEPILYVVRHDENWTDPRLNSSEFLC